MEEHKKDPPSREEPGSQEVSLGREQVEPGSKPPQSPTVAPKDLESDFITPRKRGKKTAVKRQLQLGGRESRLSNSA